MENQKTTEFSRECPKCKKTIYHKTKYSRNSIQKANRICRKCSNEEFFNNPESVKKLVDGAKKVNKSGENNPFFGKQHTEKTKLKMKELRKDQKDLDVWKSQEFKDKMSLVTSKEKNGMFGRKVYDIWVEKYGKVIADEKEKEWKNKISKATSGKKNPMYGKSPKHSVGNGFCGWYKSIFFRSLRELSYIVNVLEKGEINWKTAEDKNFRVEYIDSNNTHRTYVADFLIDNKKLVEIKPIRLQNTTNNILKREAAIKFCKNKGLDYEVVDCNINTEQIKELYLNGSIAFNKKNEKKFKLYFI